jgi:hypothetical protein
LVLLLLLRQWHRLLQLHQWLLSIRLVLLLLLRQWHRLLQLHQWLLSIRLVLCYRYIQQFPLVPLLLLHQCLRLDL